MKTISRCRPGHLYPSSIADFRSGAIRHRRVWLAPQRNPLRGLLLTWKCSQDLFPGYRGQPGGWRRYDASARACVCLLPAAEPLPGRAAPSKSKIAGVYSSKNARVIITWKKLGFITTLPRHRSSTQLFKVEWHGRAPSQDWPYFTPTVHSSMPSQWAWSPLVTPPDWLPVDKSLITRRSIIIMAHQRGPRLVAGQMWPAPASLFVFTTQTLHNVRRGSAPLPPPARRTEGMMPGPRPGHALHTQIPYNNKMLYKKM